VVSAAELLLKRGAAEVGAWHPRRAVRPAISRLRDSPFKRVVLTNTLPLEQAELPQLEVLSIAPIIAEASAPCSTTQRQRDLRRENQA